MRFKNRYLLLELLFRDGRFDDSVNEGALLAAFRESLALNFGDAALGAALASLQVKYFSPHTGLAVVRCGREECSVVQSSLSLTTHVKNRAALLRLLHHTGTLRTCKLAAMSHSKAILAERTPRLGTQMEAAVQAATLAIEGLEPIAHGALSVEASVDQSGYWPGQSVRARVVVTVSRDAPDSVSLHQLSLQCCGHERLDPTWGERVSFRTRTVTLLADCTLAPGERRSFRVQFALPRTLAPTFRGTFARYWTQVVVTALPKLADAPLVLALPLHVWPASPAVVAAPDGASPTPESLSCWEEQELGEDAADARPPDGGACERFLGDIGASDEASPLFGVPGKARERTPLEGAGAAPQTPRSPTLRRASASAAPSPLAMAGEGSAGGRHAAAASGSPRLCSYAVNAGDTPLLRIHLVPPGPLVQAGGTLAGCVDFEVGPPGLRGGPAPQDAPPHPLRVTALSVSLETEERVDAARCAGRWGGEDGRALRRMREEMWEATGDTARTSFAFTLPRDAPCSFAATATSLAWLLQFEFTVDGPAEQTLKWTLPVTLLPPGRDAGAAHSM